jgi:GrpB-like predicted nucleotidyltransferase (UPF0157 family)
MLRADDTLRARYGELKTMLQERFPQERRAYTKAKDDFIRGVLSAS